MRKSDKVLTPIIALLMIFLMGIPAYYNKKEENERRERISKNLQQQTEMLTEQYDLDNSGCLEIDEVQKMYGLELTDIVMQKFDNGDGNLRGSEIGKSRRWFDLHSMHYQEYRLKWE